MAQGKLIMDTNFNRDVKFVALRRSRGKSACFDAILVLAALRDNDGTLSLNDTTWFKLSEELGVKPDAVKEFVLGLMKKDEGDELGFFENDGERFWSNRIVKDVLSYQRRIEGNSRGGKLARNPSDSPPSQLQVDLKLSLSHLLSISPSCRREELLEEIRARGINENDASRIVDLCKEFGRKTVSDYIKLGVASETKRDYAHANFFAFVEEMLTRDRMSKSGPFSEKNKNSQPVPNAAARKYFRAKDRPTNAATVINRVMEPVK